MENTSLTLQEYVPYGPEWEKEMSKFPKAHLITILGTAYKKYKIAESRITELERENARLTKLITECEQYFGQTMR